MLVFFDVEYYRFLSETESKNISMNMDWFAKYVKEGKLNVFTVKYDGLIKELQYEDLEFIRKLSNTCKTEYENDERILNRNKIKIMKNILNGYKFTQEEIDRFRDDFKNRKINNNNEKSTCLSEFLKKEDNNRKKLYGSILNSIGNLPDINNLLDVNNEYSHHAKAFGEYLGIFKMYGVSRNATIQFIDKFNICQYFPGYIRNKEIWNDTKEMSFTDKQLRDLFWTRKAIKEGKQLVLEF